MNTLIPSVNNAIRISISHNIKSTCLMLCWSTKEAQSLLDSTRPLEDHYPVLEFIFGWLNQSWQQEFCPWGAKTFEHHSILNSFTYRLKACVLQYLQPTRCMSIFCILVMYTAYRLQGVNGIICLSDISGLWFFSSTQSQALKFRLNYLRFIILYGKGERFHYQNHKKSSTLWSQLTRTHVSLTSPE